MMTTTNGRRRFFTTFRNMLAAGGFAGQLSFLKGAPPKLVHPRPMLKTTMTSSV